MSASSAQPNGGAPSRPRRHVVKVLEPQTTAQAPGAPAPARTLYLADRLLVVGDPEPVGAALAAINVETGDHRAVELPRPTASRATLLSGTPDDGAVPVTSIAVSRQDGSRPVDTDAWDVLRELREKHPALASRVRLEHVVRPACGYWNGIGGTWSDPSGTWHGVGDEGDDGGYWGGTGGYWGGTGGYWGGTGGYWGGTGGYWGGTGGYWGGTGVARAEYLTPGRGGRLPVSVVMKDPALRADKLKRHPVVALPDSGLGSHPWFDGELTWANGSPRVQRRPELSSLPDADASDFGDEFSGARGRLFGHGTFIAGIVRQGCPEATLLPIPVMSAVGTAAEGDVIATLRGLLAQHRAAVAPGGDPSGAIDVLSLSIGYYPSQTEDDDDIIDGDDREDVLELLASPIAALIRQFGHLGVIVVAGVGNDATANRFLPAALAPELAAAPEASDASEAGEDSGIPFLSVGALNPDGTTIAMFSNGGTFTTTYRKGVSVVSTLPTTNSSSQSTFRFQTKAGDRATVDVDNYTQGFGVWSGTSFAAPTLAAELAAALVEVSDGDLTDVSPAAMRRRARQAIRKVLPPQTKESGS